MSARRAMLGVLVAGSLVACHAQRQYGYVSDEEPEARLAPVSAEVISAEEARARGLTGETVVVPFADGGSGASLVGDFLERADDARAGRVSGLAIILTSQSAGEPIECRTEIVPETVTSSQWVPPRSEQVRS